jgi:integrase
LPQETIMAKRVRNWGVTPHGLRHQFAGDLYFEITTVEPLVRGGRAPLDAAAMQAAYLEVARQLGHSRPGISNTYLGSAVPVKTAPGPSGTPAAKPELAPVGKART